MSSSSAFSANFGNIKVELKSLKVVDKLEKAIDDTYSKQGIEYKKRLMVQGIDI